VSFERYVALGDSQTEGLLDSDGHGGYRGWADRFAGFVAAANPHLEYANLAVRGRLLGQIRHEQLAPAQAMRPDLVTVMGGLNDLLHAGVDVDAMLADLDSMLGAFAGATVLTNTFPDVAGVSPLLRRVAPKVTAYNAGVRSAAARHGALVVDFAAQGTGSDPRIWSPDRIHANPVGHLLIAAAFADTLGLPGFAGWADPLPPPVSSGRGARARAELRWVRTTVVPWAIRHARGRSSGDGITAKRPRLVPVASLFHLVDPALWASGQYRPDTRDGFVHYSFADQVAATADRHYPDAAALVAVQVDPMSLAGEIRIENGFPHGYGPLPADAAEAVHPLRRDANGAWVFSGAGRASSDR
jgi:lysophospholipase L1-like esterase/uncharacterized protein (DUF952 family)